MWNRCYLSRRPSAKIDTATREGSTNLTRDTVMITWQPDNQANGMGWMSSCCTYTIRECVYMMSGAVEYWCYYLPSETHKYMHLPDGVRLSLEDAKNTINNHVERMK